MAQSRKSKAQVLEETAPWLPPEYEDADVAAIQALANGHASIFQQKRAFEWIVHKAANTYDLSYRPGPDGAGDTAFAEGRRFVGLSLVKLVHLKIGKLGGGNSEQP